VARRGFRIVSAVKGPGSIEEGVEFLKSFDIVVHPRCRHVREELQDFSYKVDKQTETVLPVLEDKRNHTIDACRYSHEGSRRPRAGAVVTGGRTH
jgi:phage terminase large subunit